jgi:hypothetical protein
MIEIDFVMISQTLHHQREMTLGAISKLYAQPLHRRKGGLEWIPYK